MATHRDPIFIVFLKKARKIKAQAKHVMVKVKSVLWRVPTFRRAMGSENNGVEKRTLVLSDFKGQVLGPVMF